MILGIIGLMSGTGKNINLHICLLIKHSNVYFIKSALNNGNDPGFSMVGLYKETVK